jgi:NADH:ubiquinone oxidoreductase subunit 2 (subunit N)
MLGMVNIIIVFESLAAAIAILLLIGKSISKLKWYLLILVAAIVLAIVGYAGVVGGTEGRYIASTDLTLKTYALQAILWLLALLTTTIVSHKKYKNLKFNLITIACLFIFQVFGMFLIALALEMTPFGEGLTSNYGFIFTGALIFTLIHYLITLPFLILAYKNKDFGKRLMNWLKVT